MDEPRVLLTNDDGIDSVGFRALYDRLLEIGDVVAVAPADDQSSVGRSVSHAVEISDHELGYAVEGTPVDCVIAGLGTLCPDVDMVVSGCNKGANLGAYVLGRSGTVSAAVEAAFFDVPAIAVSLYIDGGENWQELASEPDDYEQATAATIYLVERAREAGVFDAADYLNVNVPLGASEEREEDELGEQPERDEQGEGYERGGSGGRAGPRREMKVTRPSTRYEMGAERDGTKIALRDGIWKLMRSGDITEPVGTDRRAVADGQISVSPLTAPHTTEHHEALDELAERY